MKDLEVLKYFPELKALIGCIQDPVYHPEGDVWIHTMMCLDELAKEFKRKNILKMNIKTISFLWDSLS